MYQAMQVQHRKNAWCVVNETGHILMNSTSGKKGKETIEQVVCILNTRELCKSARTISIIWDIEDVQAIRESLTDDQSKQVLDFIRENHDANIGINWHVIESAINHLYGEDDE